MKVLCISNKEIEMLAISIPAVMEEVEKGFILKALKQIELPAKTRIRPRPDCFVHAMPCWVGGDVDMAGIKWVSGYPGNKNRGLPAIAGVMMLNDPETGFVQAIMDANWITAWRTGAASGVCAKRLAYPDSATLAVVGLGVQGRTNTASLLTALPNLQTVQAFDVSDAQVKSYTDFIKPFLGDRKLVVIASIQEVVRDADIVVTCAPTSTSPKRSIRSRWLKKEMLAIALDNDASFDADVMTGGAFFCDDRNQYVETQAQGVYFQDGYPTPEHIAVDMGAVFSGAVNLPRTGRRGVVLMGIASHDVMTARLILGKARENNVGTTIDL